MDSLPTSAFEQLRAYPLPDAQRLWSAGKTIRAYRDEQDMLAPRWEREQPANHDSYCSLGTGIALCGAHQAELDHLLATGDEEPTIAQELRSQGVPAVSLNSAGGDDESEEHIANVVSLRYNTTPYVRPSPLTMRRIDWERRTKLSSPVWRVRLDIRQPETPRVAVIGPGYNHQQRLEIARRYLARLQRQLGAIPSVEQIQRFQAQAKVLRELFPAAERDWRDSFYSEQDEDPHRDLFTLTDLELHDQARVFLEPTEDEEREAEAKGRRPKREERYLLRTRSHYSPDRPDYLASQVGFGLSHELANSEWDLGVELDNDPYDPYHVYLPDVADPLSLLSE